MVQRLIKITFIFLGLFIGGVNAADLTSKSSREIKTLLKHVKTPQDKVEVYQLWVNSLKLEIDQADQNRLAGKLNKSQYDLFLKRMAHQILRIAKKTRELGFYDLATEWTRLAQEYMPSGQR